MIVFKTSKVNFSFHIQDFIDCSLKIYGILFKNELKNFTKVFCNENKSNLNFGFYFFFKNMLYSLTSNLAIIAKNLSQRHISSILS